MIVIKGIIRAIDWLAEWTGRTASWVAVFIMLTVTFEVFMRFVFRNPTKWAFDTTIMAGGTLFILSTAYVMLHNANVRVDIFYAKWPPRVQALVDLAFTLLYLFGAITVFTQQSWIQARLSFLQHEISQWGYWEPSMVPFRFIIAYGFSLLALETLSWFTKSIYLLVTGKKLVLNQKGGN